MHEAAEQDHAQGREEDNRRQHVKDYGFCHFLTGTLWICIWSLTGDSCPSAA